MKVVRNHGLAGADRLHCTPNGSGCILKFQQIGLADNDWVLLFQFTKLIYRELSEGNVNTPSVRQRSVSQGLERNASVRYLEVCDRRSIV